MRFSANLGFLWADLPLPEAIRAAHRAGFDAVECHWPYAEPLAEVRAALAETGLPMLGVNTRRGRPGENGLAALPGRETEARAAITEALDWAEATGTGAVHVMAGIASGAAAEATFRANLAFACEGAAARGITILIEPLNPRDAPGYFLDTAERAAAIITDLGQPALRMMFDCYHMQICGGNICRRLERFLPVIGHIQIASVPDRGAPDHGELDHMEVLRHLGRLGWARPVGAEYRPVGATEDSLGWLKDARGIAVAGRA